MQAMWSPQAGSDALLKSWLNIFCFLHFLTDILSTFLCQHSCKCHIALWKLLQMNGGRKDNQTKALWIAYAKEGVFPLGSSWGTEWQQGAKAEPPSWYVNMNNRPTTSAPRVWKYQASTFLQACPIRWRYLVCTDLWSVQLHLVTSLFPRDHSHKAEPLMAHGNQSLSGHTVEGKWCFSTSNEMKMHSTLFKL